MSEQSTTDQHTGMDKFFAALRGVGVRRRTDQKWIGGVCSGVADRLGVDPVIIRVALVVLSLFWGFGIVIYLLAWVLLANDRDEIVAERALRDGHGGSIVLLCLAAFALLGGVTYGSNGQGAFPFLLVPFIVFVVWVTHPRTKGQGWHWPASNRTDADQRMRSQEAGTAFSAGPTPTTPGPSPTTFGSAPTTLLPSPSASRPAAATSRPSVPRRPRRRSGGPLLALLAIGLALTTYGSLIWAANGYGWTGDHQTIALAGSLASMGVLLVGLGVAGWRAGFVAFLTVVLAIATWSSTIVPRGLDVSGRVGDMTWTPTSASAGVKPQNYRLGAGTGVLDLSNLPTEGPGQGTPPPRLPAYVGVGDLRVLVPPGLTVKVVGHVGLGEILLPAETEGSGQSGSDVSQSTVIGDGPAEVVVDAGVGIGTLTIVKE